jgi:2-polyprenyl-3-methyl-5-hydroxy-6-metoxy-1,4-benzoquinol methylase
MNQKEVFSDGDVRAAWNKGAQAWEEFVESGADYYRYGVHGPALLTVCEPVEGLDVLDLGCGQGFFSRELARRGARVVGIDIAEQLIAYARTHEEQAPLGIEYYVMNATETGRHLEKGSFDVVTACMSLQDMANVAASLRSAFEVLRVGGRMAFSVPHPCTDTPFRQWEVNEAGEKTVLKVDRYFESGPVVFHWEMERLRSHWETPYWRYTLTEWSKLLVEAGFLIRRLHEPRPSEAQVQRWPQLGECSKLPYFLIFNLVKWG